MSNQSRFVEERKFAESKTGRQVRAISRQEEEAAARRQAKAGIKQPVRTDFKKPEELPAEVNEALNKICAAGSLGDGKTDHVLRLLYAQISRGLTCLTINDMLAIAQLAPAEMLAVGYWVTQGETLAQSMWDARQRKEKS